MNLSALIINFGSTLFRLKTIFQKRIFYLVSAIFLLGLAQLLYSLRNEDPVQDAKKVEKILHRKEKRASEELSMLAAQAESLSYSQLFSLRPDYYNSLSDEGIVLLVYDNDTLKFWSDNSVAVENYMKEVCLDDRMAKLKNGWFEVITHRISGSRMAVGLIQIKSEYPYQNHYLINSFQQDFNITARTRLATNEAGKGFPAVKNLHGDYLFSLHPDGAAASDERNVGWLQFLLNGLGMLCLVLFFKKECQSLLFSIGNTRSVLLFALLLVGCRFLSILLRFPAAFYDSTLFGPQYYGDARSFWLPSLGDFLLNAILLFYLSFYIWRNWRMTFPFRRSGFLASRLIVLLLFLSLFWFSWLIDGLFKGLIHNSEIAFNVNELFSLSIYSILGIIIIGFLLFAFFLYTDKVLSFLSTSTLPKRQMVLLFIPAAAFHIVICHLTGLLDLVAIMWSFLVILVVALIKRQSLRSYSFSGSIVLVMILTLYSVHTFLKHTQLKENDNRKVYAEKLATEQDPIAEHLYPEIEPQILEDSILFGYLGHPKMAGAFEKRLIQRYFSGYWERYDVRVTYFDTACNALIKPGKQSPDNIAHFDDLIAKAGQETFASNLYYLQNSSGRISYLVKLSLPRYDDDPTPGHLIIELESKFISEEIGFPALLLDRDLGISQQIANYSYAKYRNGKLINQYGKYHYPVVANAFMSFSPVFSFATLDGYNHLIHRPDATSLIIISKQDAGILGDVTTFSYLFAFYSLLLLLLLFAKQIFFTEFSLSSLSFKARIQSILVIIVLASLALFGFGTVFYIRQQYEAKNTENLTEKLQSVLVEVDNRLDVEELDRNYRDYSSYILKKLSNIFFTDINLYDASGNLYVSSRPEVFDEGLVSRKMNPAAYLQMAVKKKSEYVHDENIGNLNYLSAYIPFKNRSGKEIAYLNLPYFAKQSELEKEISTFLVALINIYVLLFALSIIVAIAMSNYLTRPLKLIQDKMSKVKLGKTNELIEWKQRDEIGSLISEYNRMIEELADSAQLLAKSERESAWREMAKQVAHEIKNPLTPMKLSIQHIQRLLDDKSPDLEDRVRRLSKTLIEQIDTLSSIASEFSSFAKMPKPVSEKIDLKQIIGNAIELFKDTPGVEIRFVCEAKDDSCNVCADREQILRVFNNLIKNAIQSIPDGRSGRVSIALKKTNRLFTVTIKDNGTGINPDVIGKIFVPSFTTKTGGMGLGLAMVKNILENFEGKIWFETEENTGSTFFVSLPEYADQN
jgi:two-component system nitrogen regulation sensor histidine kinase NtrY